uniref:Uncharacterized protein n=1 Tax=Anguilla anguilla TaxID=7936 RepID=A0A0E9T0A0_ANGAN
MQGLLTMFLKAVSEQPTRICWWTKTRRLFLVLHVNLC